MQTLQLRIPVPTLEDARVIASQRGRNQAQILRQAMAIGLVELRRRPKKDPRDRAEEGVKE